MLFPLWVSLNYNPHHHHHHAQHKIPGLSQMAFPSVLVSCSVQFSSGQVSSVVSNSCVVAATQISTKQVAQNNKNIFSPSRPKFQRPKSRHQPTSPQETLGKIPLFDFPASCDCQHFLACGRNTPVSASLFSLPVCVSVSLGFPCYLDTCAGIEPIQINQTTHRKSSNLIISANKVTFHHLRPTSPGKTTEAGQDHIQNSRASQQAGILPTRSKEKTSRERERQRGQRRKQRGQDKQREHACCVQETTPGLSYVAPQRP